jgi:nucleoporin SEH1
MLCGSEDQGLSQELRRHLGARSRMEGELAPILRLALKTGPGHQLTRKAHDAPLLRLAFAHPLHGSLIASCSHDRTVRVWEEPSASTSTSNAANRDGRWVEKGILTGSKGSVRDVEFAPPSPAFGLRVVSYASRPLIRRSADT